MKGIYGAKELKIYTDEDRMSRIRRTAISSNGYQDFQSYILSSTVIAFKEHGIQRRSNLTIKEIRDIANIDTTNKMLVGKRFAKLLKGVTAADYYVKLECIRKLKVAAQKDVAVLDMLARNGIDDLEAWYEKVGLK